MSAPGRLYFIFGKNRDGLIYIMADAS